MEPENPALPKAMGTPSTEAATSPNAEASAARVMLSIPFIGTAADSIFAEPNLGQRLDATAPAELVELSVPDSSALQSFIQTSQQKIVGFASGSMFWRLFVGTGFAVLVGALTLILFSPTAEKVTAEATDSPPLNVDQVPADSTVAHKPRPASIELIVSAPEGAGGPSPAEFDDPFVAENLVSAKTVHAVHLTNATKTETSGLVHQASHRQMGDGSPAWLAGTIEDAVDSPQTTRKHERSRPSHR